MAPKRNNNTVNNNNMSPPDSHSSEKSKNNESDVKEVSKTTTTSEPSQPSSTSFPEDDEDLSWPEVKTETQHCLYHEFEKWTYSYMNRLLKKGSQQTLADGSHLKHNDLFDIPTSMQSSFLASEFRYVGNQT